MMTTISDKPDYLSMKKLTHEVLFSISNPTLPIKVMPIIKNLTKNDLIAHTFDQYAEIENTNYSHLVSSLSSKDGKIVYLPNDQTYILLYEKNVQKERKVWTIAHELGHYFANHLLRKLTFLEKHPEIKQFPENLNIKFEQEANCFAKELLAPISLIQITMAQLNIVDFIGIYTILRSLFRLSKEASYYIATDIAKLRYPSSSRSLCLRYAPALVSYFKVASDYNYFHGLLRKYQNEIDSRDFKERMKISKISIALNFNQ